LTAGRIAVGTGRRAKFASAIGTVAATTATAAAAAAVTVVPPAASVAVAPFLPLVVGVVPGGARCTERALGPVFRDQVWEAVLRAAAAAARATAAAAADVFVPANAVAVATAAVAVAARGAAAGRRARLRLKELLQRPRRRWLLPVFADR